MLSCSLHETLENCLYLLLIFMNFKFYISDLWDIIHKKGKISKFMEDILKGALSVKFMVTDLTQILIFYL